MHASTRPELGRALNAAAIVTSISGAALAGFGAMAAGYGAPAALGGALGAGLSLLTVTGWVASRAAAPQA